MPSNSRGRARLQSSPGTRNLILLSYTVRFILGLIGVMFPLDALWWAVSVRLATLPVAHFTNRRLQHRLAGRPQSAAEFWKRLTPPFGSLSALSAKQKSSVVWAMKHRGARPCARAAL
jgi:hypothetical protein